MGRNLHHCLDKQDSVSNDIIFIVFGIYDSYGIFDVCASCGIYEQLDSIFFICNMVWDVQKNCNFRYFMNRLHLSVCRNRTVASKIVNMFL